MNKQLRAATFNFTKPSAHQILLETHFSNIVNETSDDYCEYSRHLDIHPASSEIFIPKNIRTQRGFFMKRNLRAHAGIPLRYRSAAYLTEPRCEPCLMSWNLRQRSCMVQNSRGTSAVVACNPSVLDVLHSWTLKSNVNHSKGPFLFLVIK